MPAVVLGAALLAASPRPPVPERALQPGTTRWLAANGTTRWPAAGGAAARTSGWGHARDVESLRMSVPLPANLSRLQERWRAAAALREAPPPQRHRLLRHGRRRQLPAQARRQPADFSRALISLHGESAMPAEGLLYAEEINCVYTKQNCTCDFDCPCEINGPDGREALWCGCEQLFNCTCEMRSGACTMGPPDDAYLFFPGMITGTGGYLAALRGEALDFYGNQSFTIEAWVRPYKFSDDVDQTLVSRYNKDVAGQWILYLDHFKRLCFQRATRTVLAKYGVVAGVTEQRQPLCSSQHLPKGAWTHVAAVYDLANHSRMLVLNGTAVIADRQEDDAQHDGDSPLVLGAHLDQHMPAGLFHGEIDDVRVWSVARTATELAAYSTYRLTGFFPALRAYWRMDEGRGSSVPDMSGNGHEAEMRGAMEWRYVPKLFGGDGDRHTGYIRAGYGQEGTASWRGMAQEVPLGVIPRDQEVAPAGGGTPVGIESALITVPASHSHWEDV